MVAGARHLDNFLRPGGCVPRGPAAASAPLRQTDEKVPSLRPFPRPTEDGRAEGRKKWVASLLSPIKPLSGSVGPVDTIRNY